MPKNTTNQNNAKFPFDGRYLLIEDGRKVSQRMNTPLNYKEKLPENCPLPESKDVALADVWRLLRSDTPTESCFESQAAQKIENRKKACECGWASCSFFEGDKFTKDLMKLPWCKNFVARAEIQIPLGSGLSKKEGSHVHFWAFDHFSFTKAIVRVEPR